MTDTLPEQTPKKTGRSIWAKIGILFSTFAILILIAGIGYGFYALSEVYRQLSQINVALTREDSTKTLSDLQQTVNSLQQSMQKSQALSDQQEKLLNDWRAAQSGDLNKWHTVQAEYLAKMANNLLQFENNVPAAIELLQQADKELQSSADPALLDIRKSIASDLANLKAMPQVDVTSIYLKLSAINTVIDKLPLPVKPLKAEESSSPSPSSSWWKSMMDGLNKIVIVQKNDASALPLVMPDEKNFLLQNLHAQIENAIWGLLHGNVPVYVTSLVRATNWTQQYFVQDAEETKSVIAQLTELQKINVHPSSVALSNTLQLFDSYRARTTQGTT